MSWGCRRGGHSVAPHSTLGTLLPVGVTCLFSIAPRDHMDSAHGHLLWVHNSSFDFLCPGLVANSSRFTCDWVWQWLPEWQVFLFVLVLIFFFF